MPKNSGKVAVLQAYLKVLSSEMDLAEIRFMRWVIIKERGAEVFLEKIRPSPIRRQPFKVTAPSRTVIGN